jgi:TonB family protein
MVVLAAGFVSGFAVCGLRAGSVSYLIAMALVAICGGGGAFAWYRYDCELIRRPSSLILGVLTFLVAAIAVPYHLIRSREGIRRAEALGVSVAVGALLLVCAGVGSYAGVAVKNPRGFSFMLHGPTDSPEYTPDELEDALAEKCQGGSSADELQPVLRPLPPYPVNAELSGIEGYVVASYEVDPSGAVVAVSVIESEPVGQFEGVVVNYVQHWRFCPYDLYGDAKRTGEVRFPFELK